jgi:hypothetical protein
MEMEAIHASLVNGQRRQMVAQINEYGLYNFWADYKEYLRNVYVGNEPILQYFTDATISYFRITNQ